MARLADQLAGALGSRPRQWSILYRFAFQISPKLGTTARLHEIAIGASEKDTIRCGAFPNSERQTFKRDLCKKPILENSLPMSQTPVLWLRASSIRSGNL